MQILFELSKLLITFQLLCESLYDLKKGILTEIVDREHRSLPAMPAFSTVENAGGGGKSSALSRLGLLGKTGSGFRQSKCEIACGRFSARCSWRKPDWKDLYR